MEIKQADLLRKIKAGLKGGNYLFLGDESFLKEKAILQFQKNVFGEESPGMNMERLAASTFDDAQRFILLAQTVPFLARGRLLVLEGVEKLDKKAHDKMMALAGASIPATTTLVITSRERSLDKRRKHLKALMDNSTTTVFWPLFENQIPAFIGEEVGNQGKKIDPRASDLLIRLVGRDLSELSMEIDKLCSYVGSHDMIGADDVRDLVDDRFDTTLFTVVEALASGRPDRAAEMSWQLLSRDSSAGVGLVKILGDTYSGALQARLLMARMEEMPIMMRLAGEWGSLSRRSDFRSNQRKTEIRREISKIASVGLKRFPFCAALFKNHDTRILSCLQIAAGRQADAICRSIEALGDADGWLKGARDMAPLAVVMICMERLAKNTTAAR